MTLSTPLETVRRYLTGEITERQACDWFDCDRLAFREEIDALVAAVNGSYLTAERVTLAPTPPDPFGADRPLLDSLLDYLAAPTPPDALREFMDAWTPMHTGYCASQDDDAECVCGVGPEYERMLFFVRRTIPTPPDAPEDRGDDLTFRSFDGRREIRLAQGNHCVLIEARDGSVVLTDVEAERMAQSLLRRVAYSRESEADRD